MRPRKIETLKDLRDFITQFSCQPGVTDESSVYINPNRDDQGESGELLPATFLGYMLDGPGTSTFIVIEHWTDEELRSNAEHNDQLGTPPHFVS